MQKYILLDVEHTIEVTANQNLEFIDANIVG